MTRAYSRAVALPVTASRKRIGRLNKLSPYDDKVAVGAWYYTATFDELDGIGPNGAPVRHRGEGGAYLLVDHLLFQSADDPKRRLAAFVQFGVAQQVVDRIVAYVGAGLVAFGIFPGRSDDDLGLGVAMARNGAGYITAQQQADVPVSPAETAIELTYSAQLADWMGIQPDVQYVISPDTDPRRRNATVAQWRFELSF